MAGGIGTRLWPLSRKTAPKQFQKLIGDRTLLQQTFDRIIKSVEAANIWVITGADFAELVKEQLPEINPMHILTEPVGRNTAPATGLATLAVLKEDPDAVLFGLLPADHYVGKEAVFAETTESLFGFLENNPDYVATIGIFPAEPNTGLGYIKKGSVLGTENGIEILKVDSFHEKPDLKTAKKFVTSGRYLWNGGYYLFNGAQMIEYYRQFLPETLSKLEKFLADPTQVDLYTSIPSEPIDKAISEKLDHLAVAAADMEWSDIGNWATLHEILAAKGTSSQVVIGKHIGDSNENTLIMGGSKLIATVGLKDVVVIDTEDIILVCHRDSVQDVKKVVEQLHDEGREEYL